MPEPRYRRRNAKRRRHDRQRVGRGSRLTLGLGMLTRGEQNLRQVPARGPLETRVALVRKGGDRRRSSRSPSPNAPFSPTTRPRFCSIAADRSRSPIRSEAMSAWRSAASARCKIAELAVEVAEVRADRASVAHIAGHLEGVQCGFEGRQAPPEVARRRGARRPRLMDQRQGLRLDVGLVAGGRTSQIRKLIERASAAAIRPPKTR